MSFEIALPEDDSRTFGDYIDALKRRGKPALIMAASLFLAGIVGIVLWPNAYTSTAVILIEDPDIPPGLVPTTVTTFAARQIQYINQRVMTRSNLASIIEKFNLFPEERKYLPTLLLVPDVEKRMSIDIIDVQQPNASGQQVASTIAFRLGFEHEAPETARAVANELVSLYMAENVRSRTEQTA
ncbi:MAG: lipopolysaccharide biosynthesis protein, partial [Gammaproteobacteria bacterium]|nr:lipopolysaccharide biosynthesis protein [Gammaproteobacteria bacterium]